LKELKNLFIKIDKSQVLKYSLKSDKNHQYFNDFLEIKIKLVWKNKFHLNKKI
jgi:hypothetical protein